MNLWMQRLWIQLTSDRKRFGALCVMVLIGLLLWSRVILVSQPPRTVVADDQDDAQTEPSESDNDSSRDQPRTLEIILDEQPARDPFRISSTHFPKSTPLDDKGEETGKSGGEADEETLDAETLRTRQLQELVDKLRLEAVMTGRPMAIINGQTYQRGDDVPAPNGAEAVFRLVEINPMSVVLECEGRRFERHMTMPGGGSQ